MDIKCDTEKMYNISRDIDVQLERYKEIMKQFYEITDNFDKNGWVGSAANNYSKYLKDKKGSYDEIHTSLTMFNEALKNNISEINHAVNSSRVRAND